MTPGQPPLPSYTQLADSSPDTHSSHSACFVALSKTLGSFSSATQDQKAPAIWRLHLCGLVSHCGSARRDRKGPTGHSEQTQPRAQSPAQDGQESRACGWAKDKLFVEWWQRSFFKGPTMCCRRCKQNLWRVFNFQKNFTVKDALLRIPLKILRLTSHSYPTILEGLQSCMAASMPRMDSKPFPFVVIMILGKSRKSHGARSGDRGHKDTVVVYKPGFPWHSSGQ